MRESVHRPKSRKVVSLPCSSMVLERRAAGVRGGDQRAHTGACNIVDRDFVLFEDAQHADMSDPARESAAESDAYFRALAVARVSE